MRNGFLDRVMLRKYFISIESRCISQVLRTDLPQTGGQQTVLKAGCMRMASQTLL